MFSRAVRLLLVGMLMVSIGLHWTLLQVVAWSGMMVKYTRSTSSVCEALARTFDGEHPCRLCLVIREGKNAEKAPEQSLSLQKLELFAELALVPVPPAQAKRARQFPQSETVMQRSASPPVPPPRVV